MHKKKKLPLSDVYRLIEPGPVVLLSTHFKGEENVMTMSWLTMLEFVPPLIGCVVSNRDHSFQLLKSSKECVINIPTADMARIVTGCGNTTGGRTDKFSRFRLTKLPAKAVSAPIIAECFANLECKVIDTKFVSKYNFFVLEVVEAWMDSNRSKARPPATLHHRGKGHFMVAGETIKLPSIMK